MANIVTRTLFIRNVAKIKHFSILTVHPYTSITLSKLNSDKKCRNQITRMWKIPNNNFKCYSSNSKNAEKKNVSKGDVEKKEEKPSLFKKFKIMYRDYWYVLVPVHIVTSTMWFGSFYFMAKR